MLSSDESEQLAYLAADGSDSEAEELDSDPDDESDEDADGPSRPNGFFDLEAADSEDEQSESGLSGIDNNYYSGFESWSDKHFPQFRSLPFELRHRIWQFFCPELAAKSRVFWFEAECNPWGDGTGAVVPVEGPFLEQQTRSTRSLLAIHRETRELVLKALPDTLHFGSHGVIRFNSANDIVFLDCLENVAMDLDPVMDLVGFAEHIRHLAVEPAVLSDIKNQPSALSAAFKNLETVYYLSSPAEHNPRHLRWCTSDMVKHYSVTTFEEEPGLGEDGQHMYCWPDLKNHLAFAESEILLDALADDLSTTVGLLPDIKGATFKDAPIWPIVRFLLDSDMRRYDDLLAWDGEAELDWESSEDEDSSGPDEYESEGIDDSDISEDGSTSDNEGLIVLDDDDSSRGGSYAGDNSSVVSWSPSLGSQNEPIDLTGGEGEDMAPFSSPEPSSTTLQESEESAQESNRAVTQARRLKRRRAHIVESDSEDESDNAGPRKRARTNTRRNPVVLSSSDEADEEPKSRRNRRASTVTSVEEEDENDEEHHKSDSENGQSDESSDSSSTSSSSDEDSDGDDAVPRPLSLVEKLQLHRETNPIPSSDDEGSAREETGGDESDGQSYADFQDDEEGDEVSEDGDEHDQYDYEGEDDDDQEGY